jgi:hypothetical protein
MSHAPEPRFDWLHSSDNRIVIRRRRKPMTTSINRIGLAKATLSMVLAVALNAALHAQTAQSKLSPDET